MLRMVTCQQSSRTSIGHKPLAYYSSSLDPVLQGHFACEQSLAAAAFAVEKSLPIMLEHPTTLFVEHAVYTMVEKSKSLLTPQ